MKHGLLPWSLAVTLLCGTLHADTKVGFIETFALAPDREAVLTQLLPGTEEYYFFHALHYQNTAQAAKLDAIMKQWAQRFPESERRKIIENRAALLAYDANPQATLEFLKRRLNLQFFHEREVLDQPPNLPSTLDQARVAQDQFQGLVLQDDSLEDCSVTTLEDFVRRKVELRPPQQRSLLQRFERPDVEGILEIIAADLRRPESRGFGEFNIHRALLPEQLDALAKQIPTLLQNRAFVLLRLEKLRPGADVDVEEDVQERGAWLDRLWTYARNLSPSFDSLKAFILYRRLDHDRKLGIYDRARFLEYLKLPRRYPYMNPEYLQRPGIVGRQAELSDAELAKTVLIPPLPTDEPLVREYLLELLKNEANTEAYAPYLRDTYLNQVFAESKIVNGIGNPDQWASLLTPAQMQFLKDRVDLDFPATAPRILAPADDVKLKLQVKNVQTLLVRIYEINTLAYYLAQKRQLNTDINIDGLIANVERSHDLGDADGKNPFRRVARTFDFPELKGRRGAWIIEFIGGGKSSRALVRKGQWQVLQRVSAAGDALTIVDEDRKPVKDAVVWLDGRRYAPDEKTGAVVVPFTSQEGDKPLVLADAAGEFASLTTFQNHAEAYQLDTQFHIDREQLLARREATLAITANLLSHGSRLPLQLLEQPRLQITATTLDGVATTMFVDQVKLEAGRVFTHKFQVPERLSKLDVTLTAKVAKVSAPGEKVDVRAEDTWQVNGIDRTKIADGYLSKFGDKYVFEMLGRNGEPLRDRAIRLEFIREGYQQTIPIDLRTNEQGRIELGALAGIREVNARLPDDLHRQWTLKEVGARHASAIHAKAGELIQVAWPGTANGQLARSDASLLEKRAGSFVVDRFAAMAVVGGAIEIKGLPPGDYSLVLRQPERREIQIRVTAGERVANWLLSPYRYLEVANPVLVQISAVETTPDALMIRLKNANPLTRVHLVATRFLPDQKPLSHLGGFQIFDPGMLDPARRPNLFTSGRDIGDEYRYILERRFAKIFPGVMLTRPGLLLNPWDLRSTETEQQALAAGTAAAAAAGDKDVMRRQKQAAEPESAPMAAMIFPEDYSPDLNFLATVSPLVYDVQPDDNGVVRVERKSLGDRQYLQILVADTYSAQWRNVALPEVKTAIRDLRLTQNLDPQKPFTESREVTPLKTGESLKLADVLGSDVALYDSLSSVHSLLSSLLQDQASKEKLGKFEFILRWPQLKPEEKRAKYSEFACHELNFFLSRKDPEFFKAVIQPYLRNKKDKTFMDEYLIEADLKRYLQPWQYARLNVVEKALLAKRIKEDAAATARYLRESWELNPVDPAAQDRLFEAALRGRSLSDAQLVQLREEMEQKNAPVIPGLEMPNEQIDKGVSRHMEGAFGGAAKTRNGSHPAYPMTPATAPDIAARGAIVAGKSETALGVDAIAGRRLERTDELSLAKDVKAQNEYFFAAGGLAGAKAGEAEVAERFRVRALFRSLGPTKEWAENNYYRLPLEAQGPMLIPLNAFWRDFAAWNGEGAFFSQNLAEAHENFTEIMLALAVLDLPFDSAKHETKVDDRQYTITVASPALAYHKQLRAAAPRDEGAGELLVSESFQRHDDPVQHDGNQQTIKYVTGDFLQGVIYTGKVVVTNPTETTRRVQVLIQIPRGSVPAVGTKTTDSRRLELKPYSTQSLDYSFYFPVAADQPFPHYPAQVTQDGKTLAAAKQFSFQVIPKPRQLDEKSWDYISQYGTDDEVFTFLEKNNLHRIDLERIAWRARAKVEFLRRIIAFLRTQHIFSESLWRYGVAHNEKDVLAEWLRDREDFVSQCGPWLQSPLVSIDPIERRVYQHLEYSPLVNQRAHRLGAETNVVNPAVRGQYQAFLNILAHKPTLDAMDQMSVVYYHFLQDRVGEALAMFAGIKPESLPTRLQHDYFRCYAAFYEERVADARGIATQYAQYPVPRWQKLFAEVVAQADEIDRKQAQRVADDQPNRDAQQAALAATEPSFEFKVEDRKILLNWQNLKEVNIAFYLMDPELMFSSSPFVAQDTARLSIIKPAKAMKQELPADGNNIEIPLPQEYQRANVLVEITGAGQRKAQAYHANNLRVNLTENYGQLDIADAGNGKPVSKAYVKVYARLKNGQIRYYKDGYTDLRGRFDYASLNSTESGGGPIVPLPGGAQPREGGFDYQMITPGELGQVDRLSILVLSSTHGAALREASPPAQ